MDRPLLSLPNPVTPDACPCGATAYVMREEGPFREHYLVRCPTCGREGDPAYAGPAAIQKWNGKKD